MRSLCVVVPLSEGESVRKKLSLMGLLNISCRMRVEEDRLYIPVTEEVDLGYPVTEEEFIAKDPVPRSYKEVIVGIPEELQDSLPTSFDTIGDIAILKMPEDLLPYVEPIGNAMLKANPSIRLVAMDMGVQGDARIRDLSPIAGKGGLETIHVEHGLRFEVDVSRCYFSPRLATERKRVADAVKDGERVLDMFAGVGPFAIMIAKSADVERVWAVDINPVAIEYLKRNLRLNRVGNIEAICADARDVVKGLPPLNRIVMNLPHTGHIYLPEAISACANDAVIHYYEILSDPGARQAQIEGVGGQVGREVTVESIRKVRSYSPTEDHYAFDIKVHMGGACGVGR